MTTNIYEGNNRTLAVIFTCSRCKNTKIAKLEDSLPKDDLKFSMYRLILPDGWVDLDDYNTTLCPKCAEAYKQFMNNSAPAKDIVVRCEEILCGHCNDWCEDEPCEPDDCVYIQSIRSVLSRKDVCNNE